MRERIRQWYHGKVIMHPGRTSAGGTVMPSFSRDLHWTARIVRWTATGYLKNWKELWAIVGVLVGIVALFK